MIFKRAFPFYRQYDAMDCGPACLRMIAAYYGKRYSLQFLRDKSYASRDGASLLGLCDAAAAVGLAGKCVLASLAYLTDEARLPCIVHWDNSHFVVVYKSDGGHVYVADPAYGKTKYGKDDFLSRWAAAGDEGYALLLEPTAEFYAKQEIPAAKKGLAFLLAYLKPYRRHFGQLLAAMLLGSLIQLLLPFLTQMIVDKGIARRDIGLLQLILLGQFVLIASRVSVNYLRGWILFAVSAPLNIALVHDFLRKLAKLPLGFFDVKLLGDALQRITDHQRIETFLTQSVLGILLTAMNIVVFGIVLATYSLPIFSLFAAGTVLYLAWIRLFLRRRREIDFAQFRLRGKHHNAIIQFIMGMQEIRLNNCEGKKIADWVKIQDDLLAAGRRSLALTQNQQSGCLLLQEGQNILITYFAARAVIAGDISLGMMLAVQFIIGQLTGPVEQLVHFTAVAQDAKLSFERIEEIHARPDEEAPGEGKREDVPPAAGIAVANVSFQYQGPYSPLVLRDVSLSIPPRKTTAIVGASGSGKTTLIKLLLGVYQPTGGRITVGDIPLAEISRRSWRAKCGLVMQDGFIFAATVADNIALTGEAVDESRMREAARAANIAAYIESLPLGYKTMIGADGQGLSQGQKQRILIARALYKNPAYLFFDEATNALDAAGEAVVMANLAPFFRGRTVVIVAHRLSTVKNADQIVVLDKGAVVETGTHPGLIARRGFYYNLVKEQLALGN